MTEPSEVGKVPESQKSEPEILTEVIYRSGQENKVAYLPILEQFPLKHAFTWGKESRNMSPRYAGEEGADGVRKRIEAFLSSSGIDNHNIFNTTGVFEGTHLQMQEIVAKDTKSQPETAVEANFIFTRDPEVVLSIRPGDCNVSIVYAKDRQGRDIIGLIHSSAQSTNAGLPKYAIEHLIEQEDVIPSSIIIAITPGISKEHYSIDQSPNIIEYEKLVDGKPQKAFRVNNVIVESNWKQHIALKDLSKDDEQKRPVDILGATIMQYVEEGVNPQNIQAYDINAWEAAGRGESFSNRYSSKTDNPQGRFMIAVQLKNRTEEGVVSKSSI